VKKKIIAGVILGVVVISFFVAAVLQRGNNVSAGKAGGGRIGVIYIEGPIIGGEDVYGLFGAYSGSESIMARLRMATEDPSVKAVILRVNSPGGSAAASQEIAEEVERLRASGKPVVVSMADVAASGAYWISAKADKIVSNPATITGSIGVIMSVQNYVELYEKLGIEMENITSGKHKDMGSPSRPLTDEERQILKSMVNDIYQQFVEAVAEGRNMKVEEIEKLADGRIFTGRQALELGLVDELGNYYDAVKAAAELAGIEGKPVVVKIGPKSFWEEFRGLVLRDVFLLAARSPSGRQEWGRALQLPLQWPTHF